MLLFESLPSKGNSMVGSFRLFGASAVALLAVLGSALAWAAGPPASSKDISVELNKLEANGEGCRAYVVIDNAADSAYPVLKLDLVLFRPDGVIDRRIALDLGPLRAKKKYVKTFDLDASPCDGIASILVNDVLDCKEGQQAVPDCLDRIAVSSRASATLSK